MDGFGIKNSQILDMQNKWPDIGLSKWTVYKLHDFIFHILTRKNSILTTNGYSQQVKHPIKLVSEKKHDRHFSPQTFLYMGLQHQHEYT